MFISRILRLMAREWSILCGDWKLLTIVLIMPFAYTAMVCFLYLPLKVTNVPIYVVDNDRSSLSRSLRTAIGRSESFKVVKNNGSIDEFKIATRTEEAFAYIVIPENFQNDIKAGKSVRLLALVDGSNILLANTIRGGLAEIGGTYSAGVVMKRVSMKGTPTNYAMSNAVPIEVQSRILYSPTFSYAAFILPALIGTILQQIILLGVALTFSRERDKNLFPQVLGITKSPLEVLSAKSLFYIIINMASATMVYMLLPRFGVNYSGSTFLFFMLLFIFVFTIVGVGVCFSAILGNQLFATEALMLVSTPSFLLSGYSWPQFAMIPAIKAMSEMLPLTHFILPLRAVIYEQATMADIYRHVIWLWTCALICYTVAYLVVWRLMAVAKHKMEPAAAPVQAAPVGAPAK